MKTTTETTRDYSATVNAALASKPATRPTANEAAASERREREAVAKRNAALDRKAKEIMRENPKLPYAAALIQASREAIG